MVFTEDKYFYAYLKAFIQHKDVQLIILSAGGGLVLQVLCRNYIKRHPELFLDTADPKKIPDKADVKKQILLRRFLNKLFRTRGGALHFPGILALIQYIANYGFLGMLSTAIVNILTRRIAGEIVDSAVARLQKYFTKKPKDTKIFIDLSDCAPDLQEITKLLETRDLSDPEIQRRIDSGFKNYYDLDIDELVNPLKGKNRTIAFIIAMVSMLIFLAQTRMDGFHYLMRKLLKAVKEYRITKSVARVIVRRLLKAGIRVDPELMEILVY